MEWQEFFSFRKMITPVIIQVVFWIGLVAVVVYGLYIIQYQALAGLLTIVFGALAVRLYSELLIVIFKIHEALNEIRDSLKQK